MAGGTTFHFVTDGSEAALERARAVVGERDVAIAGGAATVNQYLAAGLIDEPRLHVVPVLLGAGERLLEGAPNAELEPLGQPRGTALVTHLRYRVDRV
jgi:dihydrofolate reductase